MISQEYSLAISETLDILDHTKKEDVDKISTKFLNFLKENASKTYVSCLDFSKPLKEMNLNQKTIGILSLINKKFWCNDDERLDFEMKLKQNELSYQNKIREKYNPDNLFKKQKSETLNLENNTITEETAIIEYKEKNFLKKIFDKSKHLFKKN